METLSKFLQSSCKTCCDGEQQASIHSPKPPRITIHDYLVRLCKYYPCRNVMIGALVLFIKLSDSEYHICCLNVHRVFLTCILLSSKFVVDEGCINTWFAKLGGITVDELKIGRAHV